jgi:hypothetical protein
MGMSMSPAAYLQPECTLHFTEAWLRTAIPGGLAWKQTFKANPMGTATSHPHTGPRLPHFSFKLASISPLHSCSPTLGRAARPHHPSAQNPPVASSCLGVKAGALKVALEASLL